MQTQTITLGQITPAIRPEMATKMAVKLPVGGPVGTGGMFSKGTVLASIGGATANEVRTLTIGGSPTGGTFTITYTADKVYSSGPLAYNATTAVVQAALQANIWGTGNVTVTGTAGSSYVVTFGGQLANLRIGGYLAVDKTLLTGGTPTASWATTTQGNAGAGQFDAYLNGTNSAGKAILAMDNLMDPQGGIVTGGQATFSLQSPLAFVSGFFNRGDLIGADSTLMGLAGWRYVLGNALTDTGVIIGLGI